MFFVIKAFTGIGKMPYNKSNIYFYRSICSFCVSVGDKNNEKEGGNEQMRKFLASILVLSMVLMGIHVPVKAEAATADEFVPTECTGYGVLLEESENIPMLMTLSGAVSDETELDMSEEAIYNRMIALQEDYPEGMPWTNDDFYAWNGGIYSGGYGCAGFAFILSDAAFGTLPARFVEANNFDSIRVGDVLRINDDTHSVIVLEVYDDYVVIAEGNYNSSIHWGRTLTKSSLDGGTLTNIMTRYETDPGEVVATATPAPTVAPTATPTVAPTATPTVAPTATPTAAPTATPTIAPTEAPTAVPTTAPTAVPTEAPTAVPTAVPTVAPTAVPTVAPTAVPTAAPTAVPTAAPTAVPTAVPTVAPTAVPTEAPTAVPTVAPTAVPTEAPTAAPTAVPTVAPTAAPTAVPTVAPTAVPTVAPTAVPTVAPTAVPTAAPTAVPTEAPTAVPTVAPTAVPTAVPTVAPTAVPTAAPTAVPTEAPTAVPTVAPTAVPTVAPTAVPTAAPTAVPTVAPTAVPTVAPTAAPTAVPTAAPTAAPAQTPASKQPVATEDGKEGWQAINQKALAAKEGGRIEVYTNGNNTVPGTVFESIKGKNVDIFLNFGNGISWTINGLNVTDSRINNIDFTVILENATYPLNNIPQKLISDLAGSRKTIDMSIVHDGNFGFAGTLHINLGAENAGKYANLYYYNETTGKLEFECASKIGDKGITNLTLTHASEYTIVIDNTPMQEVEVTIASPKTGDEWSVTGILILGALIMVTGAFGIVIMRRKKY